MGLFIVLAQPVSPQILMDSEDPRFEDALSLWLDGEEETSLPILAGLASASNVSAQVLLGLIDKKAALQGPYLSFLPRAERIALLRAPGGISGRNWMHDAADESALAQNWIDLWQMQGNEAVAQRFSKLDEDRATREALLTIVARSDTAFDEDVLAQPWYPSSLAHLTRTRVPDPEVVAQRHPGDPMRQVAGLPVADADLQEWLQASPLALPLRATCEKTCEESAAACALALYKGLAGYDALLVMGSPVADLVSDVDFAHSRRGIASVARRIMLNHSARTRDTRLQTIREIDSCTADWLSAEYMTYYPRSREQQSQSD